MRSKDGDNATATRRRGSGRGRGRGRARCRGRGFSDKDWVETQIFSRRRGIKAENALNRSHYVNDQERDYTQIRTQRGRGRGRGRGKWPQQDRQRLYESTERFSNSQSVDKGFSGDESDDLGNSVFYHRNCGKDKGLDLKEE